MSLLTVVPRYDDVVDEAAITRWLAAHAETRRHWETLHTGPNEVPGPCCLPFIQREEELFPSIVRMGGTDV